jgi:hypothetical protein
VGRPDRRRLLPRGDEPPLAERVELRICAVPTPVRREISSALGDGGLARVAGWIAGVARAGNAWRASDHRLVVGWAGGILEFDEDRGGSTVAG